MTWLIACRPRRLRVTDEEAIYWRDCADHMMVRYNTELGVHEQAENFTDQAVWDFAATPATHYPLLLHYPYFELYRKQQADVTLAWYLRGDAFTADEKARNFSYSEALTVRDSSLCTCAQAVMAAEVGHLQLAFDYLAETAFIDLHSLHNNVSSGQHIAGLAGAWLACVAGFGGMRSHDGQLAFAPQLPPTLTRLVFRILWRNSCLEVEVTGANATYLLTCGGPLQLTHPGQAFTLGEDAVTLAVPTPAAPGTVAHPDSRGPHRCT